jgi:hypothetical protein
VSLERNLALSSILAICATVSHFRQHILQPLILHPKPYTLNPKHNLQPLNPTLLDSFKCVHTPQLLDPVRAFQFVFPSNKLVITNIDIQSVEPVDQRTREALSASVQQAIEITTKSQEAAARHDAERKAQEAEGLLERQKLKDEIEVLLSPNF